MCKRLETVLDCCRQNCEREVHTDWSSPRAPKSPHDVGAVLDASGVATKSRVVMIEGSNPHKGQKRSKGGIVNAEYIVTDSFHPHIFTCISYNL